MDFHTIKVVLMLTAPFLLGTLWAVINAAQKDFETFNAKLIWLFIAAIPFIGFIIYLIFGMRKGKVPVDQ